MTMAAIPGCQDDAALAVRYSRAIAWLPSKSADASRNPKTISCGSSSVTGRGGSTRTSAGS